MLERRGPPPPIVLRVLGGLSGVGYAAAAVGFASVLPASEGSWLGPVMVLVPAVTAASTLKAAVRGTCYRPCLFVGLTGHCFWAVFVIGGAVWWVTLSAMGVPVILSAYRRGGVPILVES